MVLVDLVLILKPTRFFFKSSSPRLSPHMFFRGHFSPLLSVSPLEKALKYTSASQSMERPSHFLLSSFTSLGSTLLSLEELGHVRQTRSQGAVATHGALTPKHTSQRGSSVAKALWFALEPRPLPHSVAAWSVGQSYRDNHALIPTVGLSSELEREARESPSCFLEPRLSSGTCLELHTASQRQQHNKKGPRELRQAQALTIFWRCLEAALCPQYNLPVSTPQPLMLHAVVIGAGGGCRSISSVLRLHTALAVSRDQHRPSCCLSSAFFSTWALSTILPPPPSPTQSCCTSTEHRLGSPSTLHWRQRSISCELLSFFSSRSLSLS
jgi:hypothetical protein